MRTGPAQRGDGESGRCVSTGLCWGGPLSSGLARVQVLVLGWSQSESEWRAVSKQWVKGEQDGGAVWDNGSGRTVRISRWSDALAALCGCSAGPAVAVIRSSLLQFRFSPPAASETSERPRSWGLPVGPVWGFEWHAGAENSAHRVRMASRLNTRHNLMSYADP